MNWWGCIHSTDKSVFHRMYLVYSFILPHICLIKLNVMNYELYVFSQLFHLITETEEPYDMVYPIIIDSFNKYEASEFNDDNEPMCECMRWYLEANVDTISLTIADHCNL